LEAKAQTVTVYHNGALVSRSASVNLQAGSHDLQIKGISSQALLKSLKFEDPDVTVLSKSLVSKLSAEGVEQLQDQKDALEAQLTMLESKYQEEGFVQEVGELERMLQFYGHKIQEIKRSLRNNAREIKKAEELAAIEMDHENAAILNLTLSVSTPISGALRFSYVVGGVGWSPAYEISVENSAQEKIDLKYVAKVMNQTGENWKQVKVLLSSESPVGEPIVLPQPSNPWVIGNQRAKDNAGVQGVYNSQWGTEAEISQLKGVRYEQISVPSFLDARVLEGKFNIPSNGTVLTFAILRKELAANYYYYGYPSLDPEVYLVAEITGWETLGLVDGMADIIYSGNEVGRSLILWSEVEDRMVLPIGRDNSVYMNRSEIADEKYFQERLIGKKRKNTMAYQLVVKNNNSFQINFKLMEQVPLSQTKSAEVEMEETSGAAYDSSTGDISWNLSLSPSQSETKRLIYTIDLDGRYTSMGSGSRQQKYRTMSAPSF